MHLLENSGERDKAWSVEWHQRDFRPIPACPVLVSPSALVTMYGRLLLFDAVCDISTRPGEMTTDLAAWVEKTIRDTLPARTGDS